MNVMLLVKYVSSAHNCFKKVYTKVLFHEWCFIIPVIMLATQDLYCIVTTVDGVPIMKNDGTIMQYTSTQSMRNAAKHLTFTTGKRHHTWGITKAVWFAAKKHFERH
jgi:hypothetical protein